jgi:hypothetical protein
MPSSLQLTRKFDCGSGYSGVSREKFISSHVAGGRTAGGPSFTIVIIGHIRVRWRGIDYKSGGAAEMEIVVGRIDKETARGIRDIVSDISCCSVTGNDPRIREIEANFNTGGVGKTVFNGVGVRPT